ncbi:hypothetical protein H8M03_00495 [Sphingomonas sabuli]|uniref:PDZ domain-containing protein n=1 Tax=Sphingomonas sabuli TaxID=2764186 RepID=A0A7G9L2P0_9SPHN|nr:hypothetical protein [Sphingomonas sabuli]QNM82889.1 hypothetical protein H8M03_00495 [Sphingomonas sabuli]
MKPPARLRSIPAGWARGLRALWVVCFVAALAVGTIATLYAVRATTEYQPAIHAHGLDFDVTTSGKLSVYTAEGGTARPQVREPSKLVAVNGRPVAKDAVVADFAGLLSDPANPARSVTLRRPGGQLTEVTVARSAEPVSAEAQQSRNFRFATRLTLSVLACIAMLTCSALLALRRPRDPVAMILAFAFAVVAASVDPPLQLWLWTDYSWMLDLLGGIFIYLFLIGMVSFPDGVFVPRFMRWLIPLGILFAIPMSIPVVDEDIQGIGSVGLMLALVSVLVIRFRREPEGIARQQIKWAAFGFGSGLFLILVASLIAAWLGDDPSTYTAFAALSVLSLFSLGVMLIPLGLLVALLRFRLWEADKVISRSAAYALVTMIVGVVWAATADLSKMVVTSVVGGEHEAAATVLSAIVAAGVFAPTQSVVVGWTKRRFVGAGSKLEDLAEQLSEWRLSLPPDDIAQRVLERLDDAIHPAFAVLSVIAGGTDRAIATRGRTGTAFRTVDLVDREGTVGRLVLGRRSDGNRYNREELEALRDLAPDLAAALRTSLSRHSREDLMLKTIEQLQQRIADLEGGKPKPA